MLLVQVLVVTEFLSPVSIMPAVPSTLQGRPMFCIVTSSLSLFIIWHTHAVQAVHLERECHHCRVCTRRKPA